MAEQRKPRNHVRVPATEPTQARCGTAHIFAPILFAVVPMGYVPLLGAQLSTVGKSKVVQRTFANEEFKEDVW